MCVCFVLLLLFFFNFLHVFVHFQKRLGVLERKHKAIKVVSLVKMAENLPHVCCRLKSKLVEKSCIDCLTYHRTLILFCLCILKRKTNTPKWSICFLLVQIHFRSGAK